MSCDSDDCAAVATERRGRALFCTRHAREYDEAEATLLCGTCPNDAEYTVDGIHLCRGCAAAVEAVARDVRPLSRLCDFDECDRDAIVRCDEQQFCAEHAGTHAEVMREIDAGDMRAISQHLAGARSALQAWFKDASWTVYLECAATGMWTLRLERTSNSLASVTLRADSDPEALAWELLAAVRAST